MVRNIEVHFLPDGRTNLIMSRSENTLLTLSLLNALPGSGGDQSNFERRVGVSVEEARSLDDELSIIGMKLFGHPAEMSEEDRERYELVMPKEPRTANTGWDRLPKIKAEKTPEGRVSYVLARGELSIFVGALDVMLEKYAPDKSRRSRTEIYFRLGGAEIEEVEDLRDSLRQASRAA